MSNLHIVSAAHIVENYDLGQRISSPAWCRLASNSGTQNHNVTITVAESLSKQCVLHCNEIENHLR